MNSQFISDSAAQGAAFLDQKIISSDEYFQKDVANVANIATLDLDDAEIVQDETLKNARKVITDILAICKEQPGELMEPKFLDALRYIRKVDPKLATEYRVKIKRAKPSGD